VSRSSSTGVASTSMDAALHSTFTHRFQALVGVKGRPQLTIAFRCGTCDRRKFIASRQRRRKKTRTARSTVLLRLALRPTRSQRMARGRGCIEVATTALRRRCVATITRLLRRVSDVLTRIVTIALSHDDRSRQLIFLQTHEREKLNEFNDIRPI